MVGHPVETGPYKYRESGVGEAEQVMRMWVSCLLGDRMKKWFPFDASIFFQ